MGFRDLYQYLSGILLSGGYVFIGTFLGGEVMWVKKKFEDVQVSDIIRILGTGVIVEFVVTRKVTYSYGGGILLDSNGMEYRDEGNFFDTWDKG
jgi:hypothetical protein